MRDKKIDVLKFIGIMCIILAHVFPPNVIFQIRNFDVVLMIMISSILFLRKEKQWNVKEYYNYIIKRVKRLIFPTWIFLTISLFIIGIVDYSKITPKIVLLSYMLGDGIDYFWVIRVYFILAVVLPLCQNCICKMPKIFAIGSLSLYIGYEVLYYLGFFHNIAISYLLIHAAPLILIIAIANWIMNTEKRYIVMFSMFNFLVFIVLLIYFSNELGYFVTTNYMKYPFRTYYLSYAFSMSGILFAILKIDRVTQILYNKIVMFVSENSLWIYLQHTIYIFILNQYFSEWKWYIKYIVVVVITFATIYVKNIIIKKIEELNNGRKYTWLFKG